MMQIELPQTTPADRHSSLWPVSPVGRPSCEIAVHVVGEDTVSDQALLDAQIIHNTNYAQMAVEIGWEEHVEYPARL